ncbi:hypothetical protein GOP47_0026717 [Adiantum capillus-veneris]|nr:hypothetical protein GOP47_0026717 [Adiantum capillus-veneris]
MVQHGAGGRGSASRADWISLILGGGPAGPPASYSGMKLATSVGLISRASVQSEGFWSPTSNIASGIWSIENDLEVPETLYSGPYAQGGQGSPPMLQERFQSVISQLF